MAPKEVACVPPRQAPFLLVSAGACKLWRNPRTCRLQGIQNRQTGGPEKAVTLNNPPKAGLCDIHTYLGALFPTPDTDGPGESAALAPNCSRFDLDTYMAEYLSREPPGTSLAPSTNSRQMEEAADGTTFFGSCRKTGVQFFAIINCKRRSFPKRNSGGMSPTFLPLLQLLLCGAHTLFPKNSQRAAQIPMVTAGLRPTTTCLDCVTGSGARLEPANKNLFYGGDYERQGEYNCSLYQHSQHQQKKIIDEKKILQAVPL